jgi:C4-dicarboxylate-specific signal transduction histidine kinase
MAEENGASVALPQWSVWWFAAIVVLLLLLAAVNHRRIKSLEQCKRERTIALDKLQRSEAYADEVQRLSHTGSLSMMAGQEEVALSEEAYRIYDLDPATKPSLQSILKRTHPEDAARVRESFACATREGMDIDLEYRCLMEDGSIKHVRLMTHALRPESETPEYVGAVTDITQAKASEADLRRAECALCQAQADLEYVDRATTMGELTASLAHEIIQPIAAAMTNANTCVRWLTRDEPDLNEAREAALRMVKDTARAAEIINRIRQIFKKESPPRVPVDVNEVIREMTVLLRSEAMDCAVVIRTELDATLPAVLADRVQLQQVLMNLMVNGLDAMKEIDGTRELLIRSGRTEEGQLQISVSDTGVGLHPQHANQIFNSFYTTKPHGTGLGLRISRSIIEAHCGRLWAAEKTPRGAIFYFTLPIHGEGMA